MKYLSVFIGWMMLCSVSFALENKKSGPHGGSVIVQLGERFELVPDSIGQNLDVYALDREKVSPPKDLRLQLGPKDLPEVNQDQNIDLHLVDVRDSGVHYRTSLAPFHNDQKESTADKSSTTASSKDKNETSKSSSGLTPYEERLMNRYPD